MNKVHYYYYYYRLLLNIQLVNKERTSSDLGGISVNASCAASTETLLTGFKKVPIYPINRQ
jgi:hypothetical protein